jgi:methylated-DNA-[protein]-cysteine S-methyltransferase
VAAYEAGTLDMFDVPLQWDRLGAFQRAVLEATAAIPYGDTTTYGHIATIIGRPGEARAVGQALRMNPWAVIVPCHRVVAADGALTGYGGGPATGGRLDRKAELLAHERSRREPSLF